MSWQLASFLVLAVALAAGFQWYERGRPDSRLVALVATLAALAALGRIAFAALPNVKPTTDIVLIAGLTLGAAPGFTVGALAGLTSNFFFGQGPWTPWQMAAWGATGLIGALLGRLVRRTARDGTARPIGRWPLALACAVCGYAFTTAQDVGDWVNFSDHSLAQLWVYLGRGVGFDLVHAGGCLVFALAFGPALASAITRFSARLTVTWRPAGATLAVALAAVVLGAGGLSAPAARAAASPEGFLLGAQNGDGGFGGAPGQTSGGLFSGWAALGLAAAGHNPADVRHGGASLLDYVSRDGSVTGDTGALERTMLVAGAAGRPAAGFGGRDLPAMLAGQIRGDGSVQGQANLTAFAILALRAVGATVPGRVGRWLAAQQNRDGGFGYGTAGGTSDVDDTGAVLEALGARSSASTRAVHFLRAHQNGDGGFPAQPGGPSNAQSTAWAVQGLLAVGTEPDTVHRGGSSPTGYLRSLIAPDGHVRYARGSDQTPVWVTAEVLLALARRPFPLAAVSAASAGAGAGSAGVAATSPSAAARHRARHAARRAVSTFGVHDALGALLDPTAQAVSDRALAICAMTVSTV